MIDSRVILSLALTLVSWGCSEPGSGEQAVGQLESERVEVVFEAAARIVARGPAEGSDVAAGTVLYQLDTTLIDAELRGAEALVDERAAQLEELTNGTRAEVLAAARAELAGARDALEFRTTELERIVDLAKRDLASATERDAAKAALDDARATLTAREARLSELTNGARPEELRRAEAALARARADRDRLAELFERHTLTAPVAGRLDEYLFEVGERPQTGQPGATLLTGEQPHASVFLPMAMRAELSEGSVVSVDVDGLDTRLDGRVRWISAETAYTPYFALTEHDRGRLSYRAEIELAASSERRLPEGLPVVVALDGTD